MSSFESFQTSASLTVDKQFEATWDEGGNPYVRKYVTIMATMIGEVRDSDGVVVDHENLELMVYEDLPSECGLAEGPIQDSIGIKLEVQFVDTDTDNQDYALRSAMQHILDSLNPAEIGYEAYEEKSALFRGLIEYDEDLPSTLIIGTRVYRIAWSFTTEPKECASCPVRKICSLIDEP